MTLLKITKSVLLSYMLCYAATSMGSSTPLKQMKCATTHYPPFATFHPLKNKFSGRDMDILENLADKLDWQVRVHNLPWGRVVFEIEKNNYDCFFAMSYKDERAKHLDYTQYPLHVTRYGVFFKNKKQLMNSKNLKGLSIGLLQGIPLPPKVVEKYAIQSARIVYLNSNETMMALVVLGRIDAAITNFDVGNHVVTKMKKQSNISSYVLEGFSLPVYLAFKKGQQDLDKINAELSTLISTK